jgi:hypothetical protein
MLAVDDAQGIQAVVGLVMVQAWGQAIESIEPQNRCQRRNEQQPEPLAMDEAADLLGQLEPSVVGA